METHYQYKNKYSKQNNKLEWKINKQNNRRRIQEANISLQHLKLEGEAGLNFTKSWAGVFLGFLYVLSFAQRTQAQPQENFGHNDSPNNPHHSNHETETNFSRNTTQSTLNIHHSQNFSTINNTRNQTSNFNITQTSSLCEKKLTRAVKKLNQYTKTNSDVPNPKKYKLSKDKLTFFVDEKEALSQEQREKNRALENNINTSIGHSFIENIVKILSSESGVSLTNEEYKKIVNLMNNPQSENQLKNGSEREKSLLRLFQRIQNKVTAACVNKFKGGTCADFAMALSELYLKTGCTDPIKVIELKHHSDSAKHTFSVIGLTSYNKNEPWNIRAWNPNARIIDPWWSSEIKMVSDILQEEEQNQIYFAAYNFARMIEVSNSTDHFKGVFFKAANKINEGVINCIVPENIQRRLNL